VPPRDSKKEKGKGEEKSLRDAYMDPLSMQELFSPNDKTKV
jgi:hypothetical protein